MVASGIRHSAYEELHRGDEEPGFGAGDRSFKVFGEAPIAIEPGQGSFDDPAAREGFEAVRLIRALDDFDGPLTKLAQGVEQLWPGLVL
jgi:hypothetical protein